MNHNRWIWGVLILVLALVIGFVIWAGNPARPEAEALASLQSDEVVRVSVIEQGLLFSPLVDSKQTALIFYPGGRVDYRAYAPGLRAIAAEGYPVYLVRMPLSLAVFAPNRAETIILQQKEISNWVIGGHSLGGAMAANYVYNHSDQISGLLLWAAYPPESNPLTDLDIPVVSISGMLDGLASQEDINNSVKLLPPDSQFVKIEGGNHAQFGYYGTQEGDFPPEISRKEQQKQILESSLLLLSRIE